VCMKQQQPSEVRQAIRASQKDRSLDEVGERIDELLKMGPLPSELLTAIAAALLHMYSVGVDHGIEATQAALLETLERFEQSMKESHGHEIGPITS
jgi:hypothetical protein